MNGMAAVKVDTVRTDTFEMNYAMFGTGEKTMIILPGLSLKPVVDPATAGGIADAYNIFKEEYTVYLFDRVSYPAEGYTIDNMVEDAVTAIKALGIENAVFFGVSQGGMIAQLIAINHPEMVEKLILASTAAKLNETAKKVLSHWCLLAHEGIKEALIKDTIEMIYAPSIVKLYGETLFMANRDMGPMHLQNFFRIAYATMDYSCYDELEKIQCPVFVMGSEGDRVLTPDASREIAEKLGCEIYMYSDDYGHGVYDEAADFKTRMMDFLKK